MARADSCWILGDLDLGEAEKQLVGGLWAPLGEAAC